MSRRKDKQVDKRKELERQAKRRLERQSRHGAPVRLSDELKAKRSMRPDVVPIDPDTVFALDDRFGYDEERDSSDDQWDSSDDMFEDMDSPRHEERIEEECRRNPRDPALCLLLAGLYLKNGRLNLAYAQFGRFLEDFPHDPLADSVRTGYEKLGAQLQDGWRAAGFPAEDTAILAELHERALVRMQREDPQSACAYAEQFLARSKDYPPIWNNLAEAQILLGNVDAGIATLNDALQVHPGNDYALGALARALLIAGRKQEADCLADGFAHDETLSHEAVLKQAEALMLLGRDEAALAMLQCRLDVIPRTLAQMRALLLHLSAVIAMRLGRQREARGYWHKSLRSDPCLTAARENRDDLDLPVGERDTPWPFEISYWLPGRSVEAALSAVDYYCEYDDSPLEDKADVILKHLPSLPKLVPLLLEFGDPVGRTLSIAVAKHLDTPAMRAALHEYALDRWGPDELRFDAITFLNQRGVISTGPLQVWQDGRRKSIQFFGFEVYTEPVVVLEPRAQDLHEEAGELLHRRDGTGAEALLRKALEIQPDSPCLLNNLALAIEFQGRRDEAYAMMRTVHAQFPDYFFARVSVAKLLIKERDFAGARKLLDPLVKQQRLHVSELAALGDAHIELHLAECSTRGAESWLEILEQSIPDHPATSHWQSRLKPFSLVQRAGELLGRCWR